MRRLWIVKGAAPASVAVQADVGPSPVPGPVSEPVPLDGTVVHVEQDRGAILWRCLYWLPLHHSLSSRASNSIIATRLITRYTARYPPARNVAALGVRVMACLLACGASQPSRLAHPTLRKRHQLAHAAGARTSAPHFQPAQLAAPAHQL